MKIIKTQIALYGIAVIIIVVILFMLAKRFGLIRTKAQKEKAAKRQETREEKREEKQEEKAAPKTIRTSGLFNIHAYKDAPAYKLLPVPTAQSYAISLYKAMRGPGTREAKIYNVFKGLTYQPQVSQIAALYGAKYGLDVADNLAAELTDKELVYLIDILEKIPE